MTRSLAVLVSLFSSVGSNRQSSLPLLLWGRSVFLTLLPLCILIGTGWSQSDPAAGILPFSTRIGSVYDSVDLATQSIFVRIPARDKAGKISFPYDLVMNSHAFYNPTTAGWSTSAESTNGIFDGNYLGGNGVLNGTLGPEPFGLYFQQTSGQPCGSWELYNFYIIDSTGATHPLSNLYYEYCQGPQVATMTAVDGTGYTVTLAGIDQNWNLEYTIYDKAGNAYPGYPPQGKVVVQDPDMTEITSVSVTNTQASTYTTTYTDTLGTTPMTSILGTVLGSPNKYQYADAAGNTQTFQVNYSSYTEQTAFGCLNAYRQNIPHDIAPTQVYLPSSVTTPTATIAFTYEPTPGYPSNITGRLASIKYPTGGSVSYTYSGGNNGIDCNHYQVSVPTLTRTVNDGKGNIASWTYVSSYSDSAPYNITVTETDPAKNQTVYSFVSEYQTEVQYYQGSATGTPLKTVVTCYNKSYSSQANCVTSGVTSSQITQTDVYTSFNGGAPSLVETTYDTYGNVPSVSNYDFGATYPPSGSPILRSAISYGQSWNGTSCTAYPAGTHIFNTPCYSHTMNASGADVARTQVTYSNTGHPTSTAKWTSGTSWLTNTATYNSTGTVKMATDVNGTVSTYYYDGTDGCNELLPTSVTVTGAGLPSGGLTTSTQWNCNGAVATQTTDANVQPTNYTYNDPLWRITSMTDPTGALTTYAYPNPNTFESVMNFNGTTSTSDTLITTDGLGRQIFAQTRQGQAPATTTFDSVQTSYGWTPTTSTVVGGPFTTTTVPYSGTQAHSAPSGTAATVTQQDALGRVYTVTDGGGGTTTYSSSQNDVLVTVSPAPAGENTKARQYQYDGLTRLTSVCEVTSTSGSGAGACGQSNPKTGLLTNYTYDALGNVLTVAQNAQPGAIGGTQTRTYVYDGLSRLTSEKNPESGTTTYAYDTNGTCGTSSGDLVERIDANGNTTCEAYDGLHRVTSTTYSGPNTTTNRYFVYDAATVNGQSMANSKARIAEGYTATCSTCTKVTDEGFGYTARGELKDFYESTPNSAGYYHVPMTYWANGLLETFGPFLTEDQAGYVPDGEGRAGSVYDFRYDSYPVPIISYNAASQPTQVMTSCAGSTCYPITYQYDPNTLRMTYYGAALSGGTISGSLKWNPNSSLQQLVIADPFNASDAQTCNYSADDLSRIASVNCSSAWAQTFSYDAFGNLTKSGSIAWVPGYSASTNRYTLSGTSYDADGNILNDTFNKYTWDAEGKPLSTAYAEGGGETFAFLYDAFGHKVEWSVNGTYHDSYVTIGKFKLTASGQAPSYSQFPIPGGSILGQLGGATGVQLADWLGTSRAFWSYTGGGWGQSGAHAPFGESYAYNNGYPKDFTGQDNDGAMTNTTYYFPERQYRSSQGRWLSPDPAGRGTADPSNPQSWNRYAYVLNNPLSYIDQSGLECVWDDGSFDSEDDAQTGSVGGCKGQGGTWVELGQNGNWSNQADQWNQNLVASIQAGQVGQVDILGQNGFTYQTMYNGGQTTESVTPDATTFYTNGQPVTSVSQMIDTALCGLCHSNNFVSIFTPQQIKQFALTHGWSRDFFDPLHKNWWNGGLQLRSDDTTCSTHMAIDLNASAAKGGSVGDWHVDQYNWQASPLGALGHIEEVATGGTIVVGPMAQGVGCSK